MWETRLGVFNFRVAYVTYCFALTSFVQFAGRKVAPMLSLSWPQNRIEQKAGERGHDGAGSENEKFWLAPFLPKTALG